MRTGGETSPGDVRPQGSPSAAGPAGSARGARPSSPPADGGPDAIPRRALARLYRDYRVRQARALIGMLPRDAVRPLYRRARAAADDGPGPRRRLEPSPGPDGVGDPMAILVDFCEALLPLPGFDVWLADLRRHPQAHWRDIDASADAPTAAAPATVDSARFQRGTRVWRAHLRGFRDRGAWRGFIAFEQEGRLPRRLHRTALIFRESTLDDLRDRFRGFRPATLEAFLRSSLE